MAVYVWAKSASVLGGAESLADTLKAPGRCPAGRLSRSAPNTPRPARPEPPKKVGLWQGIRVEGKHFLSVDYFRSKR